MLVTTSAPIGNDATAPINADTTHCWTFSTVIPRPFISRPFDMSEAFDVALMCARDESSRLVTAHHALCQPGLRGGRPWWSLRNARRLVHDLDREQAGKVIHTAV